jgi:hypothetical protein
MKVEAPSYIEVGSDDSKLQDGVGYVKECKSYPLVGFKFALVIISDPKHRKAIKAFLDKNQIVS